MRRFAAPAIGLIVVAIVWEVVGRAHLLGTTWPPLSGVVAYLVAGDHRHLLLDALGATGTEALRGLVAGSLIALALAALSVLVPPLAPGLTAFASIVNGIPVVAVAGLAVLTLPHDATPVVVAALAAGFIVFVAATAALGTPAAALRDLFAVYGASPMTSFVRLAVPAAIPAVLDGMRSAAPAAVVGAIVGEWFAAERGLGPLLVSSMQNYAIEQLWAIALIGTCLSIALFTVLGAARDAAAAWLR